MPSFGRASMKQLETCHPTLQRLCFEVILFYDFSVLEGHRTTQRQQELFAQEATTLDGVTKLSKHQSSPSMAVDLMPWPPEVNGVDIWQDKFRWNYFGGLVMATARHMNIRLRWGGDWDGDFSNADQSFHDLPHFELME